MACCCISTFIFKYLFYHALSAVSNAHVVCVWAVWWPILNLLYYYIYCHIYSINSIMLCLLSLMPFCLCVCCLLANSQKYSIKWPLYSKCTKAPFGKKICLMSAWPREPRGHPKRIERRGWSLRQASCPALRPRHRPLRLPWDKLSKVSALVHFPHNSPCVEYLWEFASPCPAPFACPSRIRVSDLRTCTVIITMRAGATS